MVTPHSFAEVAASVTAEPQLCPRASRGLGAEGIGGAGSGGSGERTGPSPRWRGPTLQSALAALRVPSGAFCLETGLFCL